MMASTDEQENLTADPQSFLARFKEHSAGYIQTAYE
jgi:hypothetical protein